MSDFAVKAKIYNILNDNPAEGDRFLVDTNVWLFCFFPKLALNMAESEKAQKYVDYSLKKVRGVGGRLFHCRAQLLEIAHVIEETLFDVYKAKLNQEKLLRLKDYRKNDKERAQVLQEIKDCWAQINTVSDPVDVEFNARLEEAILTHLANHQLDQFDAVLLECSNQAEMSGIITDDADYAQVDGLQIFTYNQRVIQEAQKTNRLLVRKKVKGV